MDTGSKLQWFDNFIGQHTAIFDDFRIRGVSFNYLLRILDRYPIDVPVKGGFTYWNPREIVITCPLDPWDECTNRETGEKYENLD